jgi:hypothetical protein
MRASLIPISAESDRLCIRGEGTRDDVSSSLKPGWLEKLTSQRFGRARIGQEEIDAPFGFA